MQRRPDSLAAEAAFRKRLKELGAELLEPEWLGTLQPHRARCRNGHNCSPRPNDVQQGRGICITCAGKDARVAEAVFRSRLAELGCTPLFEKYCGRNARHHVRCAAGHDCYPRPGELQRGRGPCRLCTGLHPGPAEAAFRADMAKLGAVVLGEYRNAHTGVHCICPDGHDCYPAPHAVQRGRGICAKCAGKGEWDVFYVVTSQSAVKFGITTRDPRTRLGDHARAGFTEAHRIATGLPANVALDTENAVKAALALAREVPLRGKEYFDISCLALILDVADSWLGTADAPLEPVATEWVQGVLFAA